MHILGHIGLAFTSVSFFEGFFIALSLMFFISLGVAFYISEPITAVTKLRRKLLCPKLKLHRPGHPAGHCARKAVH